MADADNDRSAERPHYFPAQPGTGTVLVDFCYVDPVDPVPEPMTADDLIQELVPLVGWRYVEEGRYAELVFGLSDGKTDFDSLTGFIRFIVITLPSGAAMIWRDEHFFPSLDAALAFILRRCKLEWEQHQTQPNPTP